MPAYLDHKANTLPVTMPEDFYGERQIVGQEKAAETESVISAEESV